MEWTGKRLTQAARSAADWIDAQDWPDGDLYLQVSAYEDRAVVAVDTLTLEAFTAVRRMVGRMDRKPNGGGGFYLRGEPVENVAVHLRAPADTCERVQVGTKEVPVYETRCPESVLALSEQAEGVVA